VRLCIAAVGQRLPAWVDQAWKEYSRRFPPSLSLDLKQIRMPRRARNVDVVAARNKEGDDLLAAVPSGALIVTLDEKGKQWSTRELAGRFEVWLQEGRDVAFLIGGPDGLSQTCKARADFCWALGRATFPHALIRVMVAEQLYRAWTVTQNHPYHRD
jgi:23S rRNA (pseudouridine1915-N3)-methyltransferase